VTIRGLEEKLRTESERFQTQYALAQKAEAARSQLVHDYHSLESEIDARKLLFLDYQDLKSSILVKSEEHATLLNDIDMLEKEKTCMASDCSLHPSHDSWVKSHTMFPFRRSGISS
jgi:hypothetical protein